LKKYKAELHVGSLDSKKAAAAAAAPPTPPATPPPAVAKKVVPQAESKSAPTAHEKSEALDPYGSLIPFADPSWYQSVSRVFAERIDMEPRC